MVIRFQNNQKQQFTRRNVRQQRAHMTRSVPSYRHDMLKVHLTVLLLCPIISMTRILSCCAQIGRLVITNRVGEFFRLKNIIRILEEKARDQNVPIETAPSQTYSGLSPSVSRKKLILLLPYLDMSQ